MFTPCQGCVLLKYTSMLFWHRFSLAPLAQLTQNLTLQEIKKFWTRQRSYKYGILLKETSIHGSRINANDN